MDCCLYCHHYRIVFEDVGQDLMKMYFCCEMNVIFPSKKRSCKRQKKFKFNSIWNKKKETKNEDQN